MDNTFNHERASAITRTVISMANMYRMYCNITEKDIRYEERINFTVKRDESSPNKGQYGYYITTDADDLDHFISEYKIKSILDLGIGAGVLFGCLRAFNPKVEFAGYDIEPSLLHYCNGAFGQISATHKDILTLKKEDVEKYNALYFWEPLAEKDLAKKFVTNLKKIVVPGQYIFYKCAGSIGEHLAKCKNIKLIDDKTSHICVYQVQ